MPEMTSLNAGELAELEATRRQMVRHLRLVNDVLARTPMAGRYWIFGGALLGYVREGNLLLHDSVDADFAFLAEDLGRLEACLPRLVDAGFRPRYRYPGIEGDAFEWSLERGDAKVEFFRHDVVGDNFRYYTCGHRAWGEPSGHVYNVYEIPAQPLEEFRFLGRTWLRPRDPERQLTAMYGDWRTPNPGWDYMRGPNIVETHPWAAATHDLR
jgi:hypothetical protein